ncbi:lysozyme inhibitor LprI family protein [Enterocloster lavalensis]|uniref:lysozyme inhibitor LprI family protein n=1 Tax=Enterocloster lavalensis TaxID=460384 RepID=UPI002A8413EE|nr:lysozyme inhibitor LprI family protein [Enterocloster lavalensis]
MKNKRIWLVIVCILVVGVLVTRYTSSVVNREEPSQEMAAGGAEMRMTEVEAEAAPAAGAGAAPESTAGSPSPAVQEKHSVPDAPATQVEESGQTGALADEASAEAAPAMVAETQAAGTAVGPGARAAADPAAAAATGSAGAGAAAATGAAPGPGAAAGASSGTGASTGTGNGPGAGPGAAASTTTSMPASPLEGVGGRAENTTLVPDTDYRQRLVDLDNQIQKLREEDKDSSAYSLKASAESELKLWEGEMNTVYNALLDKLNEEDAATLAAEQQEWMKSREARAVENNAKNNAGSLEGVGVTTSLTALTRDRAYELVDRYEELMQSK